MADEAILRIVLQDSGGGTAGGGGTGPQVVSASITPSQSSTPTTSGGQTRHTPAQVGVPSSTDPIEEEARAKFDRMKRQQAVDIKYQNMLPPPLPELPFDAKEEAQKRLDRIFQPQEIDEEFNKLAPMAPIIFDPMADAQKRLDRLFELQEVDAAFAKLAPMAEVVDDYPEVIPFDPKLEAMKRHNLRERAAKIEAADEEMYGTPVGEHVEPPTPSAMSGLLSVGRSLHPAIRGHAGRMFGAALNIGSAAQASGAAVAGASSAGGAAVTGAAGAATGGAGAALSAAAGPIGVAVAAVVALGVSLTIFKSQVEAAAGRLGEYSATISQAQAKVEVRETMGELGRAESIGPQLATFIDEYARAEQQWETFKNEILKALLDIVNPLMKLGNMVSISGEVLAVLVKYGTPLGLISDIARLLGILVDDRENARVGDPTDILLNTPGGQTPPIQAGE